MKEKEKEKATRVAVELNKIMHQFFFPEHFTNRYSKCWLWNFGDFGDIPMLNFRCGNNKPEIFPCILGYLRNSIVEDAALGEVKLMGCNGDHKANLPLGSGNSDIFWNFHH